MQIRAVEATGDGVATAVDAPGDPAPHARWVWVDIVVGGDEIDELLEVTSHLDLDPLAVRDAVEDLDIPKVDDFGSSVLLVLHGLADDRVETYEIDCFLTGHHLVTIHRGPSPSVNLLWAEVQRRPEITLGGPDELAARLADVLTRRLFSVLDAFDAQTEEMIAMALRADPLLVGEVTAVRADLAKVRRAIVPQREALDVMRTSTSALVTDAGRRRFSDVFDVSIRAVGGVDAARTALAETLDAYRGAEAHKATEVTKVLTIYAAIMLPLSLVAGFFGMNFANLPGVDDDRGWVWVAVSMGVIAALSLGMFVALGWIRRPTGRGAGIALGRGLVEAARAPVQLVGAVLEISTMPLRNVTGRITRPGDDPPDD